MRQLFPAATDADLDRTELLAAAAAPAGDSSFVRFNMVSSLDGVAVLDGASAGLGTPADRRLFPLLRAVADAIVVGSGTVRAEGYEGELVPEPLRQWRRAAGRSERPATVVLSHSASLDPALPLFAAAPEPILVVASAEAPADRVAALREVADVLVLETTAPADITAALSARGLRHLHHEGGPRVLSAYLAAGAVDSLCLTLSPVVLPGHEAVGIDSPGEASVPRWLSLNRLYEEDSTLLADYRRAAESNA